MADNPIPETSDDRDLDELLELLDAYHIRFSEIPGPVELNPKYMVAPLRPGYPPASILAEGFDAFVPENEFVELYCD